MQRNQRIATAAFLAAAIGMWALGTLATPLYGQRNFPGGRRNAFGPGPNARQLAQQLNFTEEQKSQAQNFLQQGRTQLQALRNDATLTREQKTERMREIQQQTRNNIRSLLTTEQQLQLEELQKQAQERQAAMADRVLKQMVKRLDLTESQKTTIQSYIQEQAAQLKALRDNTSLTREQKLQQIQDLRQQTRQKIQSALTPEQQQKLDELRQRAERRLQNRRPRPGRRGQGPGL